MSGGRSRGGERGFTTIFFFRFFVVARKAQSGGSDVLDRHSEIAQDLIAWSRSAVSIDADHDAFITGPTMPAERGAGFHGYALPHRFWEHAFTISLVLMFEQAHAGHADYAGVDAVAF